RVKKPQLPPDVAESAGLDGFEPLEDLREPLHESREFAPRPKKPASRAMTVARAIVGVALVVAVSGTVAWAARRHVMSSTRFAVSEIDVTGTHHRTNDEIVHQAGLERGKNVFLLDLDSARAKILTDPWISDATIAR